MKRVVFEFDDVSYAKLELLRAKRGDETLAKTVGSCLRLCHGLKEKCDQGFDGIEMTHKSGDSYSIKINWMAK